MKAHSILVLLTPLLFIGCAGTTRVVTDTLGAGVGAVAGTLGVIAPPIDVRAIKQITKK